jgi:hypothetical protein
MIKKASRCVVAVGLACMAVLQLRASTDPQAKQPPAKGPEKKAPAKDPKVSEP